MKIKYYLFPFDEVKQNSKIIIYGAGVIGKHFAEQIKHLDYCDCLFFADRNFKEIQELNGIVVCDPKQIIEYDYDKIIIAAKFNNDEMYNALLNLGVSNQNIVRKIVFYEYDTRFLMMTPDPKNSAAWDSYYESAESAAKKQFNIYFEPVLSSYKDIDLSQVLDFACGHGRMADIFSSISKSITCCDINDTAINFCKNRFKDTQNCSFDFINNNRADNFLNNLPIQNNIFSFIYSWDAMVHFSYKWLDFYINEFYRVLSNNSYVFIHHSNYGNVGDNASENWYDHPHGRASVADNDVAFIAKKHGFTVVEQKIIDWGEGSDYIADLDCISILKK